MRVAVLDLGTNTFNLLIVEIFPEKKFKVIISTKRAVKLGLGGINKNFITPDAFARGESAICSLNNTIKKYKTEKVYAFATSAIRSAKNGNDFTEIIQFKYNIFIDVISGDKEAELIYHGVKHAYTFTDEPVLILDIGGGSNEFIIANNKKIFWKQSFNLGIARVIERFKPSNPIKPEEIQKIENYFKDELQSLFLAVRDFPVTTLVGSSGSFESFAAMIAFKYKAKDNTCIEINLSNFEELHNSLIISTLEERKKMRGLVLMRVEMIALASLFTKFVINELNLKKLIKSDYSLKEGVIDELIHNNFS